MASSFLEKVGKTLTVNKNIVLAKVDTNSEQLIHELKEILNRNSRSERYEEFEAKLRNIEIGFKGEQNVIFELKNSFIPMYIIQDLRIESDGLSAQIDFVLVTNKFICILETKKLNGNITINSDGDFIRHLKTKNGKTFKKEGMYSPIVQNNRHKRILIDILRKNKIIRNLPVYSLVVIANPKTILKYNYTPKEIRNSIIKLDQLTRVLNKFLSNEELPNIAKIRTEKIAKSIVELNISKKNPFLKAFKDGLEDDNLELDKPVKKTTIEIVTEDTVDVSIEIESNLKSDEQKAEISYKALKDELKAYRLQCSRDEGVKAYMIFNNATLDDIVEKYPNSLDQLVQVKGFGKVKVEKYGDQIISILRKHMST